MMTYFKTTDSSLTHTQNNSNSSVITYQQHQHDRSDFLTKHDDLPTSIPASHTIADIELLTSIAESQAFNNSDNWFQSQTELDLSSPSSEESISSRELSQYHLYTPTSIDLQPTSPLSRHKPRIEQHSDALPVAVAGEGAGTETLFWPSDPSPFLWSLPSRSTNTTTVMGSIAVSPFDGLKRQRSHQRTPSASTIASNGPASPYTYSNNNPQIANTDFAPFDQTQSLSKDILAGGAVQNFDPSYLSAAYVPGLSSMKGFAPFSTNQNFDDLPTQITGLTRTMTTGSSAPQTPAVTEESENNAFKSGVGKYMIVRSHEEDDRLPSDDSGFHRPTPGVQLLRTESAAYQDELYNPANFTSTPKSASAAQTNGKAPSSSPANALRTLVNQRLETANMARSASPVSAMSRDRSPFRAGSHYAASEGWSPPRNPLVSAATRRQQAKEEREQAEYAAHRPQLQREPTKTISPKDAVLDYNEHDQPSLFQDTVPAGYQQHLGGGDESASSNASPESYANTYLTQPTSASFASVPTSGQISMPGFRATSADGFVPSFNFSSPPNSQTIAATTSAPGAVSAVTSASMPNPYQIANGYQQVNPTYQTNALLDATPEFPATLTSMESSVSDQGLGLSSQDSTTMPITRPADTRANTGTYTCTYHGCTQRFETPLALQRHKREFHRSHVQQQAHQQDRAATLSAEASSASARSTESPGPVSNAGLTSAQILARNSQAGPHKCTRINPSTGKPCDTIFSRPYDLTRHEDTIHNRRKQKVRCPYCREEKTFSRNDALTRHMRVVHPDVDNFGKRGRRDD